eukprot:m.13097 g.13097  ORF g.13097 m.13097 type:complete len:164 (-) comp7429_c0_seq1:233-724(-)
MTETKKVEMSGQFDNIVHNDNIWKTHCRGEVDQRASWRSRWGFISDEMRHLSKHQRKLKFSDVRPTNYSLSFESTARKGKSTSLPPLQPPLSSRKSSASSSSQSLSSSSSSSSVNLPQIHTYTTASSPLSRSYGNRINKPLEVFGPYCRGKTTAEKSLGWPRF